MSGESNLDGDPLPTSVGSDPAGLAALGDLSFLDSKAEEEFERLARLAAKLIQVPATFLSLVDSSRDFELWCVGFGEPFASLREANGANLCHYAIASDNPLAIPDTSADPVHASLPIVASLGIAAYLGVPVRDADGLVLGTFCAVDFAPRAWSDLDIEVMVSLAANAEREIVLRQRSQERDALLSASQDQATELELQMEEAQTLNEELEVSQEELLEANAIAEAARAEAQRGRGELSALLDSTREGIYGLDRDGICTFINQAGVRMLGYPAEDLVGQDLHPLIHHTRPDGTPYPASEFPVARTLLSGQPEHVTDEVLWHRDGRPIPVTYTSAPILLRGRVTGAVVTFADTTEERRVEAERARHAAELELERSRLRDAFEQAPAGVAILRGPEHRFESANPFYIHLIGERDVVGKTVADALPEVVEQGFVALLDQVYSSGDPVVGEAVRIELVPAGAASPVELFLDFVYEPLRDADGDVTGVFVLATDVSAQVRARQATQREWDRLARVVDQFPVAVAVLGGSDPRFLAASEEYRRIAGNRPLVGRSYREAFPELAGQGYYEVLEQVYQSDVPWKGTGVTATWDADGDGVVEEHRLDIVYSPLRDASGLVEGVAIVADIVDARERAAEALRHSEERYALASHATADVIWDWDLRTGRVRWNQAVTEQFGYAPGAYEETAEWWLAHVHPDDLHRIEHGIFGVIHGTGAGWSDEYRFLKADGGFARVLDRGFVARDGDGSAVRMIGAMQDVTERRDAERMRLELYEDAQRARAEADRANQAKSQFLAQMSHEIRTPINAIIGYTDLLDAGVAGPLAPRQAEYLASIKSGGHHLHGLVNDILDLSKAEAGEMVVAHEATPLLGTAAAALGMLAPQAHAKGISLRDESAAAGDLVYVGDEDRVRQVVVNLLSNAVKFTPAGGEVMARFDVRPETPSDTELTGPGPWVVIEVEDTGRGIPPEDLERVFEPFAQVEEGHTRTGGGTGLGLTISRRFARLMGGDLTLKSAVGTGSCFTLWLPTPEGLRAVGVGDQEAERSSSDTAAREPLRSDAQPAPAHKVPGLAEVGRLLARHADPLTQRLGDRLCDDPRVPGAHGLDRAQLEDHIATFLLDMGKSLVTLDLGNGEPALVQDGTSIQRLISERHGEQRRRIGWTADEVHQEFALLRAEVDALIEHEAPAPDADLTAARTILSGLLERAKMFSLQAFGASARR